MAIPHAVTAPDLLIVVGGPMTMTAAQRYNGVMPVKTGIQAWIPACAGMTM